ncbi:MAG TPA: FHA domain-containing protein [Anaerolineales bacterium]
MLDRFRGKILRWFPQLLLGLLLLEGATNASPGLVPSGFAQTTASARLINPATDNFPRVEAYLTANDAQGNFIQGLKTGDIRILEDNNPLPAAQISELQPGVQAVIAFSPGPSFAALSNKGVSRYEFLTRTIQQWVHSRQATTQDDWSLLTTNGPEISHVSSPADWLPGIVTPTLQMRAAASNLDTLFRAVNLAADPSPRPGMGRAVLFITSPLNGNLSQAIKNLGDQAVQQSVHISVWLVTPTGAPVNPATDQLAKLVSQTGGQFFNFTGEETLPSPDDILDPLRKVYRLTYVSHIHASGAHNLAVEIHQAAGAITTPAQTLNIKVEPPRPALVMPGAPIQRKAPDEAGKPSATDTPLSAYLPTKQDIRISVDFPDGHTRPLTRTTLYVDGAALITHTETPFDKFTWDLSGYTGDGSHKLQVEVQDSLGMTAKSPETTVEVQVILPPRNLIGSLSRHTPVLAGLSVLLAGAILLLVLVLGGRIRPQLPGTVSPARRKVEPESQPIPTLNESNPRRRSNWVNRLQWPQRRIMPEAYAFLARICEDDQSSTDTPIPITATEVTLGSDPKLATLVLNDLSVDGLHAHLIRQESGAFVLSDEGSTAGTWVNYTPVSPEGTKLEQGDLVNVGRVAFRFTQLRPGPTRKPVIRPQETNIREIQL